MTRGTTFFVSAGSGTPGCGTKRPRVSSSLWVTPHSRGTGWIQPVAPHQLYETAFLLGAASEVPYTSALPPPALGSSAYCGA